MKHVLPDLKAWGGGRVITPLSGGHRNRAFKVDVGTKHYVAKSTRRSERAISWLEPVHRAARHAGIFVPQMMKSKSGCYVVDGWTLEEFVAGRMATESDVVALAGRIERFHTLTRHLPQRDGFCCCHEIKDKFLSGDANLGKLPLTLSHQVCSALGALRGRPIGVIHGDLNPSNLVVDHAGQAWLIDWDEARRDALLFDQAAPGEEPGPEVRRAISAWEIANGWLIEPKYAKRLAERQGFTV